jgi:uncharacterized protein DUF6893
MNKNDTEAVEEKGSNSDSSSGSGVWRVVGGATLVLGLVGLVSFAPDIYRYMRIRSM